MTLDELWNSPANSPSTIEREAFATQTLARVDRERRRRKGMLIFSAVIMALVTGQALYLRIRQPGDFRSAGSLYLMLASQWLLIVYWYRQLSPGVGPGKGPGKGAFGSIRDSVARLLAEVEAERRSKVGVVALFAAFAPLVALSVWQLISEGKMAPDEAMSFAGLFLLISMISVGMILWQLRYRVLPRRERLRALAREYADDGA